MDRIAVGVDGSACALEAVGFAARLAVDTNAELIILTIVEPAHIASHNLKEFARAENISDVWGEASEIIAGEILSRARGHAAVHNGVRIRTEWRSGAAAEQLSRFAFKEPVDLLVVGHAGRSRIAGVMLGSVAFKLLGIAPCPVTVVRS